MGTKEWNSNFQASFLIQGDDMQSGVLMQSIGWILIIGGIILVFLGIILSFRQTNDEPVQTRTESKGIILLGPIPIVWGFGKKNWLIAAIGVVAILLFFVFFVLL